MAGAATWARFWAGKRVLLTGHTGFKGGWLACWLARLGAQVTGFALPAATTPALWSSIEAQAGVASVLGDVRDPAALQAAFAACRPDIVFHLAAQAQVQPS